MPQPHAHPTTVTTQRRPCTARAANSYVFAYFMIYVYYRSRAPTPQELAVLRVGTTSREFARGSALRAERFAQTPPSIIHHGDAAAAGRDGQRELL